MVDKDKIIDKSSNGLLIIKARNGNFNAGFDGNPRTLPDGTIFATDKALKYCIREYLATFKNSPIFVRRNRKFKGDNYVYETLNENYENKIKDLEDKSSLKGDNGKIENLKKFLDVRLFGIVFSEKNSKEDNLNENQVEDQKGKKDKGSNISFTGPVQISYGVNKFTDSSIYPVQILSPYNNPTEKNKDPKQTTMGEQTRADEVYYVYNISVNSTNAEKTEMTCADLEILKEALLNSVDSITSCTKYGCESIALIWLNNEDNLILNNLDEFIKIEKSEDGKTELDLTALQEFLKEYNFNKTEKTKFTLKNFDYSNKKSDENKIQVIFKEGKIKVRE